MKRYDKIIIGGGFYGLYAALYSGRRGETVLVVERDPEPFMRASYVNQARVHMGYHYPRSISTAVKSRDYFDRFNSDFGFCVNSQFEQVYAISKRFSWTSGDQFIKFCDDSGIQYSQIHEERYFKKGMCDAAFVTTEYAFDAQVLSAWLVTQLEQLDNVSLMFNAEVSRIERGGGW